MDLLKHDNCILENFKFQNGAVLENVNVAYSTMGKPKYDDEGKITNLILLSHSYEESFESYWGKDIILSEDFLFDRKDYFFVIIVPLGIPDSCSPSLTKLNHNFPKYTFEDRVNFKRQFLKEKFDFTKIHAILANSVGGYESLVWAYMYPDDMELLIVLSVTYRIRGDNYIAALSIKEIIESNENFYDEIYDNSLIKMMLPLFKLCYINSIPKNKLFYSDHDEIDMFLADFEDRSLFRDIYDFYYVNELLINYDIEDKLSNVKAKTLVIGDTNHIYYDFETDILPFKELIKDSTVVSVCLERNVDENGDFSDYLNSLKNFLN